MHRRRHRLSPLHRDDVPLKETGSPRARIASSPIAGSIASTPFSFDLSRDCRCLNVRMIPSKPPGILETISVSMNTTRNNGSQRFLIDLRFLASCGDSDGIVLIFCVMGFVESRSMAFAQIYCSALGMRTSMKPSLAGIRPLPLLRRFSSPDPMEHRTKCFRVPAVRVSEVSNKKLFISMCINGSSSQSNFEDDTASIYPDDNLDKTESIKSGPVVELVNEKIGTEIHRQEEAVTPTQRSARIHDFCLGIPYGGFLFFGGLFGFIFSRNPTGLLFGSAISALSIFSLMVWSSGGSSIPFILGQTAISVAFLWRHLQSYSLSKKLFPAVFYIALSAAMICFYSYVLVAGGNPPPKKLAKA